MGSPGSAVLQYPATSFLLHPSPHSPQPPTSYFVGWNVCEATQGGLKEPEELQWPLQSPERHDAALGRLGAGESMPELPTWADLARAPPQTRYFNDGETRASSLILPYPIH